MAITDRDRIIIRKTAQFLEDLGYTRTEDMYSIKYALDNICINIIYPPNSDESEVNIRFGKQNKVFSVSWIALVRGNIKGSREKITHVIELLKYIENQHTQISDYQFCEESNCLIDMYVSKNHEKFKQTVQKFWDENRTLR